MARARTRQDCSDVERLFQVMADAAPVMIWQAGPDKRARYFNKMWLEFTGRTLEQETGEGWAAAVHPADLDRWMTTYNEAFDKRQHFELEYRLRRYDGEYRWILDRGRPFEAGEGKFLGYVGGRIDITDRKRSEAEKQVEIQDHALQTLFVIGLVATTALTDLPQERMAEPSAAALIEVLDLASTGMAYIREAISAMGRSPAT